MKAKVEFSQAARSPEVEMIMAAAKGNLAQLIECLVEAIAARVVEVATTFEPERPTKLLLTKQELAEAWGCSTSSIDRMRADGLPTVILGESPRFCPKAATEWARSRSSH